MLLGSLLVALLLPFSGPGEDGRFAGGVVRAVEVAPATAPFVQYFRLDRGDVVAERKPLGLARYVAGPDLEGGLHVELDLELHATGLRVIHVEQESAGQRRVVFRELTALGGRTLFLEGVPGEPLLGYELGGPEVVRRALEAEGCLPLILLESLRRGSVQPSEARVFDPLSAAFEPLLLESAGDLARVDVARRLDGSLRWSLAHDCGEIVELYFQEAGPRARPITPEEHERWRLRHDQETATVREAAAERARPWDELLRRQGLGPIGR